MKFPEMSHEFIKQRLMPKPGKVTCVIDTDTFNEVDDQFAVAWALRSTERLDVKAVYAAPFYFDCFFKKAGEDESLRAALTAMVHGAENPADGMEKSYQELLNLFSLLGKDPEGVVFRGSERYIGEERRPVDSPAARDLIKRAMAQPDDDPLYVIAIGAITNVVSAILMEPEIIKKIVVVWMGGQPLHFEHGFEFNLAQDVPAVQILFDCGVPLVYMPGMSVCSLLTTSAEELGARLMGKSKIGTYLADIVITHLGGPAAAADAANALFSATYLKGETDIPAEIAAQFKSEHVAWTRIIWDIATVGYVLNPTWCLTTLEPSPLIAEDCTWLPGDESRHPIRVCNYINRDLVFGDMFAKLGREE